MTATPRSMTPHGPRSARRRFASGRRAPQRPQSCPASRLAAQKLASGFFAPETGTRIWEVAAQLTSTHLENSVTVVTMVLGCAVAPNNGGTSLTTAAVAGTTIAIPGALGGGGVTAGEALAVGARAVPIVAATATVLTLAGDSAMKRDNTFSYVVYVKTNTATSQVYVGRTQGSGTPDQVVAWRDGSHRMNALGYGSAVVHSSLVNVGTIPGYPAIRGREQQVIDSFGGVGSPGVGNAIRGVAAGNPFGYIYYQTSNAMFGPLAPYTGVGGQQPAPSPNP